MACLGLFRTLGMDPAYVHTCDRAALTSSLSILTLLMLSVLEVENRWLLRARPKGKGPPKGHNLNTHFPTKDGFPNPNWTLNSWTPRSLVQLRFHHGTILDTKCKRFPKICDFLLKDGKMGCFQRKRPFQTEVKALAKPMLNLQLSKVVNHGDCCNNFRAFQEFTGKGFIVTE